MSTKRDRQEAARVIHKTLEALPDLPATQVAYLAGYAYALDRSGSAPACGVQPEPVSSLAQPEVPMGKVSAK